MRIESLYLYCFLSALVLSFLLTPLFRLVALRLKILDFPSSDIKTHTKATPYLGGVAIFLSFMIVIIFLRLLTHFPTGTLRALRGMVFGGTLIFLIGLIDDLLKNGLNYRLKFLLEVIAAVFVLSYGIYIKFITPSWFAIALSIIWIIGIINAFNIIDVIDGLSSGVCALSCLAFFFIALIGEEIYVNFASIVLAGAALGFLPFNLSKKYKIFMGDAGSLFIGFIIAAISMGTSYTKFNEIGLLAPILILGIPIFDTIFVMGARLAQGRSPFLGSKDHFALRLEKMGYSRRQILIRSYLISLILGVCAFLVTRVSLVYAIFIYLIIMAIGYFFSLKLMSVRVE